MGLIAGTWALGEAAFNRIVVQNANKVLSETGADRLVTRWFKRKPVPVPALTLSLHTFGFLAPFPPTSDTTNLGITLKANETLNLDRVTVLFNRTGGNDSYELAAFAPPRSMHKGEEVHVKVLHYRMGFSAFWGEENQVTRPLKDIEESRWPEHTKRALDFEGPYYCEIVALHSKGEARKRFTILNVRAPGKPAIVDPSDHHDYDPDRHIPFIGGFLS